MDELKAKRRELTDQINNLRWKNALYQFIGDEVGLLVFPTFLQSVLLDMNY